jgi:diguanylate cyclase (GGDEF)-like protein
MADEKIKALDGMDEPHKIIKQEFLDLEKRILSGEIITSKEVLLYEIRKINLFVDTICNEYTKNLEKDIPTGLRNAYGFDVAFKREMSKVNRSLRETTNNPYSFIIAGMDMNYLKKINDNYGHDFGDKCIFELARIIRGRVKRPTDTAARVGGDEFSIILPETEINEAVSKILKPIRDEFYEISRQEFAKRKPLKIGGKYKDTIENGSVSIGLTACPSLSPTPTQVIRDVEKAMYTAKERKTEPNELGVFGGHIVIYDTDY